MTCMHAHLCICAIATHAAYLACVLGTSDLHLNIASTVRDMLGIRGNCLHAACAVKICTELPVVCLLHFDVDYADLTCFATSNCVSAVRDGCFVSQSKSNMH